MSTLEQQAHERLAGLRRHQTRLSAGLVRVTARFCLLAALIVTFSVMWDAGKAGMLFKQGKAIAADLGLRVDHLVVEGRMRTDRDLVAAALAITEGQSILDVDTKGARERLEQLNWVASARVTRHLPDKITVSLTERTPVALWQHAEGHILIDAGGALLQDHGLRDFAHLPVVTGPEAPEGIDDLLAVIAGEPELAAQVVGAQYFAARRWTVKLANGLYVRLPAYDAAAAWSRFADLAERHDLLQREVIIVDLRASDRTHLRLSPEAAERRRLLQTAHLFDEDV